VTTRIFHTLADYTAELFDAGEVPDFPGDFPEDFRTMDLGKGRTVKTCLPDSIAVSLCSLMVDKQFPFDLAKKAEKYPPTDKQRAWMHKYAMDHLYPSRQKKRGIDVGEFDRIGEMFSKAGQSLKYPRITFEMDHGTLMLSRAGDRSKYTGAINVTSTGDYRERTWYGRIDKDGTFVRGRDCEDWMVEFIKDFAANPERVATEYGHKSGNCCFCHRALTDERSTEVGFGPVCAKKWSLKWGGKKR
jgi:hypothetical protein